MKSFFEHNATTNTIEPNDSWVEFVERARQADGHPHYAGQYGHRPSFRTIGQILAGSTMVFGDSAVALEAFANRAEPPLDDTEVCNIHLGINDVERLDPSIEEATV